MATALEVVLLGMRLKKMELRCWRILGEMRGRAVKGWLRGCECECECECDEEEDEDEVGEASSMVDRGVHETRPTRQFNVSISCFFFVSLRLLRPYCGLTMSFV